MDGLIPEHVLLDNVQVEAAHLLEDPQDVGHLKKVSKFTNLAIVLFSNFFPMVLWDVLSWCIISFTDSMLTHVHFTYISKEITFGTVTIMS